MSHDLDSSNSSVQLTCYGGREGTRIQLTTKLPGVDRMRDECFVTIAANDIPALIADLLTAHFGLSHGKVARLEEKVQVYESLRPEWAKGYSDDSIAAQTMLASLRQIWGVLNVEDQTQAMDRLRKLLLTELASEQGKPDA